MRRKVYYGFWWTDHTTHQRPYEDTNKRRLIRSMKRIAQKKKCKTGAMWEVWKRCEKRPPCRVASGWFMPDGNCCRCW